MPKRAGIMSRAFTLARLGLDRVIALAKAGELEPAFVWAAVKGGYKYLEAVASGDVTPEAQAVERLEVCRGCTALELVYTSKPGVLAAYCGRGEPLADGATCGCLIAVTVEGAPLMPAGKPLVASEECPRLSWLSVPRK